jgi:3-oxoadipate enol-lactonase
MPPLEIKSGQIEVEGGRLFYEEAGTGDCIVLIHDGLVHREVWDAQFPAFAQDHRVVRYDRRGYGKSDPPTVPYSNVADLLRVFEQLGIERACVMGMSAGGGLSIDFALAHPEKVNALVLVGAVVSGFDYTPHFYTRGGRLTQQIYSDPAAFRLYWTTTDPYDMAPSSTAARERVRQLLEEYPGNTDVSKHNLQTEPPPALHRLGEIHVPTLIVAGEYDIPDVHAHAGAIDAGIAGAQRVVIAGSGHLVPLEQPEAFNAAVRTFEREGPFSYILAREGVAAAVAEFERFRRNHPGEVPFTEQRLNAEGYGLLQSDRVDDAIELFKLAVQAFPDSWNAYDSLAEGYMTLGDVDLAINNYEKSLALNPDNAGARQRIEELRQRPADGGTR